MRKIILIYILLVTYLSAMSLWEVYEQSSPANGYDRYIILESGEVYTGGIGSSEESIYIEGNGAVIDLQGGTGIWISGDSQATGSLAIDRCTIFGGGSYGITISGYSTNSIINCNLINDNFGIQISDSVNVTIKNCIFDENQYGVAIVGDQTTHSITYCNAFVNEYDYMLNCLV